MPPFAGTKWLAADRAADLFRKELPFLVRTVGIGRRDDERPDRLRKPGLSVAAGEPTVPLQPVCQYSAGGAKTCSVGLDELRRPSLTGSHLARFASDSTGRNQQQVELYRGVFLGRRRGLFLRHPAAAALTLANVRLVDAEHHRATDDNRRDKRKETGSKVLPNQIIEHPGVQVP